jgi:hypothetical protein
MPLPRFSQLLKGSVVLVVVQFEWMALQTE